MIRMPVAPGRNLAILVEVAARNQLLRAAATTRRGAWSTASTSSSPRRTPTRTPEKTSDAREAARGAARGADGGHVPVRRPHRPVRLGKVPGDPRARGSRLLLRGQPAGHAAADARRADAARRQRDRARRGRRRRPRRQDARGVSPGVPAAQEPEEPAPGADFPRRGRAGARPPVQRDAASASAGAGPLGDRRHPRGARARCARSASWPSTSSTRRR